MISQYLFFVLKNYELVIKTHSHLDH